MVMIRIYGVKGEIECKPFQVNSADDEPEVNTSDENQIFNYNCDNEEEGLSPNQDNSD